MLLNPKALFEEDGSIDHHVDIVLRLAQRVVVIVHIHLHWLTQSLDNSYFSLQKVQNLGRRETSTWKIHLESMIVLISLARWHSQIILACQREDDLGKSIITGSPGNEESIQSNGY